MPSRDWPLVGQDATDACQDSLSKEDQSLRQAFMSSFCAGTSPVSGRNPRETPPSWMEEVIENLIWSCDLRPSEAKYFLSDCIVNPPGWLPSEPRLWLKIWVDSHPESYEGLAEGSSRIKRPNLDDYDGSGEADNR